MPDLRSTVKDKLAIGANALHRTVVAASGGRLGTKLLGMPSVRLVTTGRKTGARRQVMLTAPIVDGDSIVLVASYGGDDRHPAWYLNLVADPNVEVSLAGGPARPMVARVADAEERADLWARLTADHKNYAGYQTRTDREIPVVVLDPAD